MYIIVQHIVNWRIDHFRSILHSCRYRPLGLYRQQLCKSQVTGKIVHIQFYYAKYPTKLILRDIQYLLGLLKIYIRDSHRFEI